MKGEYKICSEDLHHLYIETLHLCERFDSIQFNHIYRTNNKRANYLSNLAINYYNNVNLYNVK